MDNWEEVIPGILVQVASLSSRQDSLEKRQESLEIRFGDVMTAINAVPAVMYSISETMQGNISDLKGLFYGQFRTMTSQQKSIMSELGLVKEILYKREMGTEVD